METSKVEIAQKTLDVLNELEQESEVASLIEDNSVSFTYNEKTYKMHLPTTSDRKKIEDYRRVKYLEYIKDDRYLFKKQWIEIYKKKGIDIGQKEAQIATYQQEYRDILFRLATTTNQPDIESIKKELKENKQKCYNITVEISNLLADSIESSMQIATSVYTASIITEVKDGEVWKAAFSKVEDLENSETELFAKVLYYLNCLVYPGNDVYELANTPKIS